MVEDKKTVLPLRPLNFDYWREWYGQGKMNLSLWASNENRASFFYENKGLQSPAGLSGNIPYDGVKGCCRVQISPAGLLLHPPQDDGIHVHTLLNPWEGPKGLFIPREECLFVLSKEKQLIISDPLDNSNLNYLHHSSLIRGKPVICAGTLKIANGRILEITLDSGHYTPDEKCLSRFVDFLEKNNVPLEGTRITLDHGRNIFQPPRTFMSVQEFKDRMAAESQKITAEPSI